MTDWRLAPSALILAPLRLTKSSQFSLRRGWNVSYFNHTCSNCPGSCHSAATLDTELTWSTWKTSKKYRHWKTASFLNPTRNIKVFKPFYGSLSTFSNVRFPFKGWTWIRTKSETLNIDFDLLRHVCFLVPSSASKPPKKVGYSSKIIATKSHLVFCKRTLWSPPWTQPDWKVDTQRRLLVLVACALNGLLSVLTRSEDSGVNALKQHRQYKY